MREALLYVDGSSSGSWGPGGWGCVLDVTGFDGSMETHEISGWELDTTNQRQEIMAAIRALEWLAAAVEDKRLPAPGRIVVHSDSAYLINCMTQEWYRKWRRNGWLNAQRDAVKNVDLWVRLLAAASRFKTKLIEWRKVKGYKRGGSRPEPDSIDPRGRHYRADRLAVAAKERLKEREGEERGEAKV